MKKKEKIYQDIEFYLNEVKLSISVNDKLKKQDGNLLGFGYIEISNGMKNEEHSCFWDGLQFFISCDYKTFKEECSDDLKKGGFENKKEIFKTIKRLLKKANKLKLI